MAQYCMPMLIVNMGGEMVYILEQRLQAQNVAEDKAKRVLQDVIRTMYNPMFIKELFRPQPVYSMSSTRQIFDRLAHSSIMRLNESSMDKLFDLMTMGFKYQLLACSCPREVLLVTHNHLNQLRSKVEEAPTVVDLVDEVIQQVNFQYSTMSCADFGALKQALCRFFSDKKVKVSLFLQEGIQKQDGTLTLSYSGMTPPGVDVPGKIVYFDASGGSTGVDSFHYPGVEHVTQGPAVDDLAGLQTHLGSNMYAKDSPPSFVDAAAVAAATAAAATEPSPPPPREDSSAKERAILESERTQQSTRDLNVLANLIGPAHAPTEAFKLNLFPDTSLDMTGPGSSGGGSGVITIDMGSKAMQSTNRDLVGIMGDMSQVTVSSGAGDDDDLLDLLDAAN
mmetsp:Transcript_14902/g.35450  ORF Transcript_14902/g.35450 Transcript_14902/m.35450 type:complete len:393 (+) Transcript_14902:67-1245(+)